MPEGGVHARINIPFVQVPNISYSEPMRCVPVLFRFLLLTFLLLPAVVQAEDAAPVLPPPSEVQDGPAARETVEPPSTARDTGLSDELAAPGKDDNVQVYSSTREDGTKIEEYAHHGHVYMVKVTPPHGVPPYYLYDNNGDGKFERRLPGGYKHPSPPEWVIKRF